MALSASPAVAMLTWARRIGWAVAALLTLWALAWLALPPLPKSQAERRLTAALGRPVTLGAVEFLQWTLELTLRDVVIGGAPADIANASTGTATAAGAAAQSGPDVPPLLRLARLHVDADARSLWQRAPVIAALDIDGLDIHLARAAPGDYDIDDLLARFAPSPDAAPAGAADASGEREAFAQAAAAVAGSGSAAASSAGIASAAEPPISADERGRWLKELYRQTRLPDKPRNLIGLAKDLSPAEMERLLKAQLQPGEEAMRDLALQRGLVVRDTLIARGLPSERPLLAAPKLRAAADGSAPWTRRVQLGLRAN